MSRLLQVLGRGPVALAVLLAIAATVLLTGLDRSGLWEPHELAVADRVVARADRDRTAPGAPGAPAAPGAARPTPPAPLIEETGPCRKQVPADALARSLTDRAVAWGMDAFGPSDRGMRLPLALLGLLTVLGCAGIAHRLAGGRAALFAGLVALSFPLLVLQARQLTSELGAPAGGAAMVWGLLALGARGGLRGAAESALAAVAILAGAALAFLGGGALLGVLVPLASFAVAGGLGAPLAAVAWRRLAGRRPAATAEAATADDDHDDAAGGPGLGRGLRVKALLAWAAAALVLGVLAHQLYDVRPPVPGSRQVLGHSIVPSDCYSAALGARWRFDDDLRAPFDSSVEQIAYGTFPWGVLAPLAVAGLLASAARRRRVLGALCLAWAAGAWIATEAFQRKVGFTIYAGFPAIAIAVGAWLDGALGHARGEPGHARRGGEGVAGVAALLVGLFVVLAAFVLGKDLLAFTDRFASLLVGQEQLKYPKLARIAGVPAKAWLLGLGLLVGGASAIGLGLGGPRARGRGRRVAGVAAAVAAVGTIACAAFWARAWQPALGASLSSKGIFATLHELRRDGDAVAILGDLGNAPRYYAGTTWETLTGRDGLLAALARPGRVFALAPASELCALHREAAGRPYFVLDDTNARTLLLSNKVDGARDRNPLATAVRRAAPAGIAQRPAGRIVYDNKIELIGWSVPATMDRGDRVEVTLYYKILAPVGGAWQTFVHFDGPGGRFNGDHFAINNRCPTSYWQPGDYITDTFTVEAGNRTLATGRYDVWTGFFTGSNPNWKNLAVSEAPPAQRDKADRVKLMTITLR